MRMNYLIHADGKMPNLALMRLSTYLKAQDGNGRSLEGSESPLGREVQISEHCDTE
jgi:hypothetical protein